MGRHIRGSSELADLVCTDCARRHRVEDLRWRCDCGGLLDTESVTGPLDTDRLHERPSTLWRYAEMLPVDVDHTVSMGEGCTPLVRSVSDQRIQFKVDYLLPTLSFKDRGAVILATLAHRLDVSSAVIDTSGNAGTAVAAYLARAGIGCTVFAPRSISPAKAQQMSAYGADVRLIDGDRTAVAAAARRVADDGVFYASHVYHPYFIHGVKTLGYEICEQRRWQAPAVVAVPIGNGTMALGLHLAFSEMHRAGLIEHLPALLGIQASAFAPIAGDGGDRSPAAADHASTTIAEGIAIAQPPRQAQIVAAVAATGGCTVTVDDDEIVDARRDLARQGWYVEPTAAVCWAAVRSLRRYPGEPGSERHRAAALLERGDLVIPLCGAGAKKPLPIGP